MGIAEDRFLKYSGDMDFPVGYVKLVNEIKRKFISHKLIEDIENTKMNLYGGIQSVTVKHANEINKIREAQYDSTIKIKIPFMEEERQNKRKAGNSDEDLIKEYRRYVDSLQTSARP